MSQLRVRSAVFPLRRALPLAAADAPPATVDAMVAELRPEDPLHCIRPATLAANARDFIATFPGDVLYAVKCNPDPGVLRALWEGGVRHFDCASLNEIVLVRQMFAGADSRRGTRARREDDQKSASPCGAAYPCAGGRLAA